MSDDSTWWRAASSILFLVGLMILCQGGVARAGAEHPVRTWTDSTGRFTIEARLVSAEGEQVLLERADGTLVRIDLEKLSAVDLNPQQEAWSFEPVSSASPAFEVTRRITVPPKRDFFEKTAGLAVSPNGHRAVIGYVLGRPRTEETTRLVYCDLESGRALNVPEVPGQMMPLAVPPEGNLVLMRRNEFGHGNQDRLELWSLSAEGVRSQVQWTPYEGERGGSRDVKWATYLPDNRLLTISSGGQVVLWAATAPAPIWHLPTKGGLIPALHPSGRWLAVLVGEELMMIDIAAGAVAAVLSAPANLHHPTLAFSPDGARLACGSHSNLYVWEMADGQLSREILLSNTVVTGDLLWTDDQHVLIGKRVLVNVDHQVRLWEYQGADQVTRVGDICLLVTSQGDKGPGALLPASLPHPQVGRALEQAMAAPDFFVLREGTRVRLDVTGIEDAEQQDEVRKQLVERLEARGFQVDDQGTITLVASTERGDRREISYRTIGRGFGVRTYEVREFVSRLAFEYEGKTAWQSRGTNLPGFVRLEEGQTMQQYLRRSERPNYTFFERIELPRLLMKPTNGAVLGRSKVTAAGIQ